MFIAEGPIPACINDYLRESNAYLQKARRDSNTQSILKMFHFHMSKKEIMFEIVPLRDHHGYLLMMILLAK